MRILAFILTTGVVAGGQAAPPERSERDVKWFEYRAVRDKVATETETPIDHRVPFEPIRAATEIMVDDCLASPDALKRSRMISVLAAYPSEPAARAMLDRLMPTFAPVESNEARIKLAEALDKEAGQPDTSRAEVPKRLAAADALLRQAIDGLAKVEDPKAKGLARKAESVRAAIKDLAPGKPAPATAGKDLDGNPVNLADYRGKVVVLDFWHTTCRPCVAMIPHEREMVKRLAGKPFVLVSVNVNEDKDDTVEFLKTTPMPWTHWYDGRGGELPGIWKVGHYPGIFVIDATGVIRFKDVRGAVMDKAVDTLLAEIATPVAAKPVAAKSMASRVERVKQLSADFIKASQEVAKAAPKTATLEERRKLYDETGPKMKDFAPRAFTIVDENPADDAALQALTFVATIGTESPEGAEAFRRLAAGFAAAPGAGTVLDRPSAMRPSVRPFAERVIAVHPDRTTRAKAAMMLANMAVRNAEYSESPAAAAAAEGEAAAILKRIIDDFAGVKLGAKTAVPVEETAKRLLDEITAQGIGKPFPDVTGEDLEGKPVKVSDYRGKVVVFDVWATWCGPCKATIPHERELVHRLKDKPFVLVSVSADEEKETLTEFLKETDMPWTHWWAGSGKVLAKKLYVRHYPTIYVLDAAGVIRYKGVRGAKMDEAVDALLKEMEAGKATAAGN